MQQNVTRCNMVKNLGNDAGQISRQDQELSDKQELAIGLMLHGLSDVQVAAQVGVARVTIYRWRQTEPFATELELQRRLHFQQWSQRIQSLLEPALDILQKQLTGKDPKL